MAQMEKFDFFFGLSLGICTLGHTEFLSVGPANKRKRLRQSTIPFFQVQQTIRKRTGLLIQRNVLNACLVFCLDNYCWLNGSSSPALTLTSTTYRQWGTSNPHCLKIHPVFLRVFLSNYLAYRPILRQHVNQRKPCADNRPNYIIL